MAEGTCTVLPSAVPRGIFAICAAKQITSRRSLAKNAKTGTPEHQLRCILILKKIDCVGQKHVILVTQTVCSTVYQLRNISLFYGIAFPLPTTLQPALLPAQKPAPATKPWSCDHSNGEGSPSPQQYTTRYLMKHLQTHTKGYQ